MRIEDIVSEQRKYFASGATKSYEFRLEALNSLMNAIVSNERRIFDALKSDLNKPDMESYMTEVGMVRDDLRFAIKHLKAWMKPRRVRTPLAQFHAKSYVLSEPYGVALIMSPWNYPFQLCFEPLTGAVSAGNCAVVKPSAYSPATSQVIAEIVAQCFKPGHVAVVQGGRKENTDLLSQKFDYIFFTGSVAVGKLVMESASKHLTPVSLELGGKSPCIIDKTANLSLAAKRLAFGKYLNAGQTCVAPDYLLVHRDVKAGIVEKLKQNIKEFFPGSPVDDPDLPRIINEKHFDRLLGLMEGEKIAAGGNSKRETLKIAPTILDNITFDSKIMQEEIFGPILPVIAYDSIDEAISAVNSRPKPLALYVFTDDKATASRVLSSVSFGGGCVNDTIIHLATPHMGFGGVGDSGMGSYHGKLSFDTFTHYKSIVDKSTWLDLPMRYHPYNAKNLGMIRRFMK